MSISVLVHGALYAEPESRTSMKGKDYARARMAVHDGESKTWITMIAFDQVADHLLQFHEGDALTVAGRAKLKPYTDKSGEPAASLDVLVDRLIGVEPLRVGQGADQDHIGPDGDIGGEVPF